MPEIDKALNAGKQFLKNVIKAIVPRGILSKIWLRYHNHRKQKQTTTIRSLILSHEERARIDTASRSKRLVPDFLTMEWLIDAIREMDHVPVFFSIDVYDSLPSLCTSVQHMNALGEAAIALAVQYDLELSYAKDRNLLRASHHAEILNAILRNSVTVLVLGSGAQSIRLRLEKWTVDDEVLIAPRPNPITRKIYLETASAKRFLETPGRNLHTLYDAPLADDCTFDVDIVYTWVNSQDLAWQAMLAKHKSGCVEGDLAHEDVEDPGETHNDRFKSRDELKYSLRSVLQFVPWVRRIHIVSNCAPPDWFDTENPRVVWVYHEEIIEKEHLPTFSSHAIESALHKVPSLAEHYIYLNDDVFLVKPLDKRQFFTASGLAKVRFEEYGMVHGDTREADPDYLNAARNGQSILKERFGKIVTKLHTHSPFPAVKTSVEACEAAFSEHYKQTRAQKFRSIEDISPTSFLYPNFAYLSGAAVTGDQTGVIINSQGHFQVKFNNFSENILGTKSGRLPLSICINDGGGSANDDKWNEAVVNFMERTYTKASIAEKNV